TWQQVAVYHVHTNGWNGIGYHLGIRRGRVAYLRDLTERGAHVKARNHELIGLVFAGDFEAGGAPSDGDLDLGRRVIACIDRWLGRKVTVGPHGTWQAGGKACPGPALRQWCAGIREDAPEPGPGAAVATAARGARVLTLNRGAALQQRIAADGFWAISGEIPVDVAGRGFVGQLAEHPTTGELRVYYVERDRWERVLWGSIQ
ncbi:MAG TPA: peptidoglycan recognition family protein, partial [Ardenticatenaceae bacterium]|nr:peptidoglycan recognition family protein [Ardenticatenaceae bacterium]